MNLKHNSILYENYIKAKILSIYQFINLFTLYRNIFFLIQRIIGLILQYIFAEKLISSLIYFKNIHYDSILYKL